MTNAIFSEYVNLKAEVEQKTARLRDLAKQIAAVATFPEGKNTAHMVSGGYDFTIQRKENTRWDQKVLRNTRIQLGDDLFFKLFDWEFKPITRTLKGFLDTNPDKAPYIEAARTVSPGAPQISFEAINQAGEV